MRELRATARANADQLLKARCVVEAVVQTIGQSLDPAGTGAQLRHDREPEPRATGPA